MPFIRLDTNVEVRDAKDVLKRLSETAAAKIGKPESYVMTQAHFGESMLFGGTDEPLVFIECKSIGLQESETEALSSALCSFCEKELEVKQSRVYVQFTGVPASMWGWKGGTFG